MRSRGLLVCSPKVYGFMEWTVTVTVTSLNGFFFLLSSLTQGELFLKYTTRYETRFTWLAAASTICLHLHLLIPNKTSARVRQGIQLKKAQKLRHLCVCLSVCLCLCLCWGSMEASLSLFCFVEKNRFPVLSLPSRHWLLSFKNLLRRSR